MSSRILNNTFDDQQDSAHADYIELSLQLQFNERSRSAIYLGQGCWAGGRRAVGERWRRGPGGGSGDRADVVRFAFRVSLCPVELQLLKIC